MPNLNKALRKIIVSLVGFPLLIVGLIMIPAFGPGLLICLLAFFILSFEFAWADTYFKKVKVELKKIYDKSKARADKIEQWGDKQGKK